MPADYALALDAIRRLIGGDVDPERMVFFTHPGAPVAKSRARWMRLKGGGVRTYTPTATSTAEEALAWKFKTTLRGEPFVGPTAIAAIFFRPNYQRIDADNLMKLVLDAGTKAGAWIDDSHITALASWIELDVENPRTLVVLCPTVSTMNRHARFSCVICGEGFNRIGVAALKAPPKFCSSACRSEGYARDRRTVRCPRCEQTFRRKSARQVYCSRSCAAQSPRHRMPVAQQRPWPTCSTCGGRVSRREYTRCVNCSPKGRPLGSRNRTTRAGAVRDTVAPLLLPAPADAAPPPAAAPAASPAGRAGRGRDSGTAR